MHKTSVYPAGQILDTWTNHDWLNGLQIESLDDFSQVHVRTRNTLYEITVISGFQREIVVRGGRFFPEKTRAHLAGSSLGGGFLKLGGIYVGFSLEILYPKDTIITTRIRSIRVYDPPKQSVLD
jgi:hypothetical protein